MKTLPSPLLFGRALFFLATIALMLLGLTEGSVFGQIYQSYQTYQPAYPVYTIPYTPPPAPIAPAPPVMATPQVVAALSPQQIDQITAPIALYPDPLVSQLLAASSYPQQVAVAAQWLAYTPNPSQVMIDMQPWDPAIKALIHYPTVLANMNANLAWTQTLGTAFVNQQADVLASIQRLRAAALAAGSLVSTPQQQVISQNGIIYIMPFNPQVIYVPQYNPALVYVRNPAYFSGGLITFGVGFTIGDWLNLGCDWSNGWISVGTGWQTDWRRDDRGRWIRNDRFAPDRRPGYINRRPVPQRWTRDYRQPMPTFPPNMVPRDTLRRYEGYQNTRPQNVGNYRAIAQPSHAFWGTYRSANTVQRQVDRGRRSWQSAQPRPQKAAPRQPQRPAYQPQQNRPDQTFRPNGNDRQVRQESQRGQQSLRGHWGH